MQDDPVRRTDMKKSMALAILGTGLLLAGGVAAQSRLLDYAADKVIKKYQDSTCAQLVEAKEEPKGEMDKLALDLLYKEPSVAKAFIDKVAAPVANKMLECGMIP
jgi:hypothetical protein